MTFAALEKTDENEGDFAIDDVARVELIKTITGLTTEDAEAALALLVEQGYTIYRKRVFKQPTKRTTARKMTPELAAQIREFVKANPHMNQLEVGMKHGVNPGRVSEALNGLR